jgi:hypothetical protein
MQSITTIGLEIAKSVFQVHGVDAGSHSAPIEASLRPGFFPEAAIVPAGGAGARPDHPISGHWADQHLSLCEDLSEPVCR